MRFYHKNRKTTWHPVFVIWPVVVTDSKGKLCIVWLETIMRRQLAYGLYEYAMKG